MYDTLEELEDELEDLLNVTPGTSDQDFTSDGLRKALNRANAREVRRAKLESDKNWFKVVEEVTWEADAVTYKLPTTLRSRDIIKVADVTASNPGYDIIFDESGYAGDVFWKDYKTLQWGRTGPGEDKTLQFTYYASAVPMFLESDEPDLIPPEHREILLWSAGIDLRRRADEKAPREWQEALDECRLDLWKTLSRGRPTDYPPIVRLRMTSTSGIYY